MSSSDAAVFEETWRRFHPANPPMGWLMRSNATANFVRFHSLPKSKRYAETADEHAVVLGRANQLATEVLGEGAPCWLVLYDWEVPQGVTDIGSSAARSWIARYSAEPSFSFVDEDDDQEDKTQWRACVKRVTWRAGEFDALIKDIADDVLRALWMSDRTGAVFAPYDGGADLFLPIAQDVAHLQSTYPDWLPAHPSGL